MRKLLFPILSMSLLLLLLSSFNTIGELEGTVKKQSNSINGLNTELHDTQNQLKNSKGEIEQQKTKLDDLLKQNDDLKKKVEYYKNKSESPSVSQIPSRGEEPKKKFYVEATAYIAMCSEGCTGKTATGKDVRNTTKVDGMRVIATDPNVIPMYSLVKVETESETFYAQALDKGGGIDGYEIDVLVSNTNVAQDFGRQKVAITVLREGKGS
jgi:3D (Asp-Asp-Asp) domain-containing protein/uncharacterized coiled-coil protein SlyX